MRSLVVTRSVMAAMGEGMARATSPRASTSLEPCCWERNWPEERGPTEPLPRRKAETDRVFEGISEGSAGYPLLRRMQWVMRPAGSLCAALVGEAAWRGVAWAVAAWVLS